MESLLAHLESSRKSFLEEVSGLTPDQWSARSSAELWSVMDVVEHIATVEIGVFDVLRKRLFEKPCPAEFKAQTVGKDQLIVDAMKDRSARRMAPDLVKPAGRWPTPQAAVNAFDQARTDMITLLVGETRNLRDYCAPHPSLKALDGYQWVLFVVTHTDRHREQIREIKSRQGFQP
jgi:hypothetical protein